MAKRRSAESNLNKSEGTSKRPKRKFAFKRGQYNTYTNADIDIVSCFQDIDNAKETEIKDGFSISKAARELKIARKSLSRWYNEWIKLGRPDDFYCLDERRGRHRSMTLEEKNKLDEIIEEKYVSQNEILIDETISIEALALVESTRGHDHALRSRNRLEPFKASNFWSRNFRKRHRLSVRTPSRTHVAALTEDQENQTIDYIAQMHVAFGKYGKDLTLAADETPIRSVAQNRTTIARVGTESVKIRKVGNEKEQLTAMLAISVSGKKLVPMIIKKGKTQRCLSTLNLGTDQIGAFSKNGWIHGDLMIKFLQESVLPYSQGRPCALSLDDFDAHWTIEVQQFADINNIELIHVPPGVTSKFQSLDVRINGILKMMQAKMQRLERIQNPARKFQLCDAVRYFKCGWKTVRATSIKASWSPMKFQ